MRVPSCPSPAPSFVGRALPQTYRGVPPTGRGIGSSNRRVRGTAPGPARGAVAGHGTLAVLVLKVNWRQALAWRMQRQLLDPVGKLPVAGVVRRVCGVQAQVASSAELAVRVRRQASRPGEVDRALSEGRLIKTWAMRGTLHLLTPQEAGAFLSLMASGRSWERPSWQRYFGMNTRQMEVFRYTI